MYYKRLWTSKNWR